MSHSRKLARHEVLWVLGLIALGLIALATWLVRPVGGCPFCSAVSQTFTEEIVAADAAVIARLLELPPKSPGLVPGGTLAKSKFEIVQVLKGEKLLGTAKQFESVYFGDSAVGTTFLVMGVDPANLNWSTPILMSERGRKYLEESLKLPKDGPERLAFFQDYLEDADDMLARDAYDEFAKAPYGDVKQIKDRMHRDKLLGWIKDRRVTGSRRRLYLTMLGACGRPEEVQTLEALMRSTEREDKIGLDALIAAYLMLKGPDGMDPVEELYLKNKKAEYTDTYAAIMALRFHGQEESVIPRARLLAGLRTMLDRPQLADLVIPDLARWEDWSATDRLVELFKNADEESSWVRVPVVKYLQACPLPKAKVYLEELTKIDPEVVKRANTFFPFGGAAPAKVPAGEKAPPEDKTDVKSPAAGKKSPTIDKGASLEAGPAEDQPAAAQTLTTAGTPRLGSAMAAATKPAAQARSLEAVVEEPATSEPTSSDQTVAAIGATSLAPRVIAAKQGRTFTAIEVCGGMAAICCGLFVSLWWLLASRRQVAM